MKRVVFAATVAACLATPAGAWEFIQGGFVCYPGAVAGRGEFSACQEIDAREARGRVPLAGWYKSAGALLLGSPKACIADMESQFLFHGSGRYAAGRSPWDGFIGNDPASKRIMERSAHGRRIQAYLESVGAFDTPAFTTLTGAEVAARFGVPVCR